MTILQMLRTTFDACKSLPKVSPSLRFFSASQAAYEPPQDDSNAKFLKQKEKTREWDEIRRFKTQVDPEYRRQFRKIRSAADRSYRNSQDNRETFLLKQRISIARHKAGDPHFYTKNRLRIWLHRNAWVRDELDWKSHKPVWSPVKVTRTCETCNIERYGGVHLWWQRKYDPSLFDCTNCFFGPGPDPRQAYPRGCEDVTTLRELRTRKQELDLGLKPGSLSQTKPPNV